MLKRRSSGFRRGSHRPVGHSSKEAYERVRDELTSLFSSYHVRLAIVSNCTDLDLQKVFKDISRHNHVNFKLLNFYYLSKTLSAFNKTLTPRSSRCPEYLYVECLELLNKRMGWTSAMADFLKSSDTTTVIGTTRDHRLLNKQLLDVAEWKLKITWRMGSYQISYVENFD